jgi:toxin ParE1/3/4
LENVVRFLAEQPQSFPRVQERRALRVALALPFPYKIFYRVREDTIEIVHIRHTARRPWKGA